MAQQLTAHLVPIGKAGKIVLLAFASGFYTVNMLASFLLLKHAYPMSIYPALVLFSLVYFFVKGRIPTRKMAILFLAGYEAFTILAVMSMVLMNGIPIFDYTKLLEPLYYLPVFGIPVILRHVHDHQRRIATWLLVIGMCLVTLVFISMIPGTLIMLILEPASGYFSLIDSYVPAALMRDIYMFYHVPVLMGSFGTAALLYGMVVLYSNLEIENLPFYALLIAMVLSVYVISAPIALQIMHHSKDSK